MTNPAAKVATWASVLKRVACLRVDRKVQVDRKVDLSADLKGLAIRPEPLKLRAHRRTHRHRKMIRTKHLNRTTCPDRASASLNPVVTLLL